jgi:hypothetical protein
MRYFAICRLDSFDRRFRKTEFYGWKSFVKNSQ